MQAAPTIVFGCLSHGRYKRCEILNPGYFFGFLLLHPPGSWSSSVLIGGIFMGIPLEKMFYKCR